MYRWEWEGERRERETTQDTYGVALLSRIDKIRGLFCKKALQKRQYSAKKTYNFIDATDHRHPITWTTGHITSTTCHIMHDTSHQKRKEDHPGHFEAAQVKPRLVRCGQRVSTWHELIHELPHVAWPQHTLASIHPHLLRLPASLPTHNIPCIYTRQRPGFL